ncbi:MAG: ABC transporter substrate-binding protein [Erysipelotrichaceae bacterium]|nr:ABC transporter substrate-binding protein [Erysipelotrichaceae bacterium]
MKKLSVILLSLLMVLTMAGCSQPQPEDDKFVVGICQLVQHPALDSATQGFKEALKEALGDKVTFLDGNGSGDPATCTIICNGYVTDGVDLIMANATPAVKAAASATNTIPVIGTSVTSYGVALELDNFVDVTGTNVSGTSDLAPLDKQAQMFLDLLPNAKTIGLLYCSGEPNSLFQVGVVKDYLEAHGLTVKTFSFSSSADVALVTTQACSECDALYIPTDNTAAECAELIGGIILNNAIPVIAGEEGICQGCGIATLTIDYYQLGVQTGKMAAQILKGEADPATLAIQYFDNPTYKYNKALCEKFGVTVPEGYVEMN